MRVQRTFGGGGVRGDSIFTETNKYEISMNQSVWDRFSTKRNQVYSISIQIYLYPANMTLKLFLWQICAKTTDSPSLTLKGQFARFCRKYFCTGLAINMSLHNTNNLYSKYCIWNASIFLKTSICHRIIILYSNLFRLF